MNWVVAKMKWVMVLSGVLTSTMVYAAVAPQAALRSTFGASLGLTSSPAPQASPI